MDRDIKASVDVNYCDHGVSVTIPLEDLLQLALDDKDYGLDAYTVVQTLLGNPEYREEIIESLIQWTTPWPTSDLRRVAEGVAAKYLDRRLDELAGKLVEAEGKIARYEAQVERLSNLQGLLYDFLRTQFSEDDPVARMDDSRVRLWGEQFEKRGKEILEILRSYDPINISQYVQVPGYQWSYESTDSRYQRVKEWRDYLVAWMEGGVVPALPPEADRDALKAKLSEAVSDYFREIGIEGDFHFYIPSEDDVMSKYWRRPAKGVDIYLRFSELVWRATSAVFDND